jgi:hypothetical protein
VQEEAVPPALNWPARQLVHLPPFNEYPPEHESAVQFEEDVEFAGLVVVNVPVGFGQSVQVVAVPPALYLLDGHPTQSLPDIIYPGRQEVAAHILLRGVYLVAHEISLQELDEVAPSNSISCPVAGAVYDVVTLVALLGEGHCIKDPVPPRLYVPIGAFVHMPLF